MKTSHIIIILGIIISGSIIFGTYQSIMYQCGTMPVFMETPRNPTLWKCLDLWKHQSNQQSLSSEPAPASDLESMQQQMKQQELSSEQQCANSYNVMQTKISQIRQTDFLSVSDYVQELDTLLEIKKDIQRLDCESTAYQWIHLATNTQKISEPPEIVIERTYDNVRTITNNQLVIPQYVVPWKILDYLQQHGIEFTNAPSNNAIQTDEGWRDPTRLCSRLLFTNGTQFYASATFHPDPLKVTGIFVDLERPTDCQKYFSIPRGFQ